MRIAVVGGGPGGLYFAALARQLGPEHEITVWERNAADDTFGFGVVFSDETLGGIEHADPVIHQAMQREFARWDDIDVHYRGEVITSGGHGFAAMSRRRLLQVLHERCAEVGVRVRLSTPAPEVAELAATHDLVVAADGVNSAVRARYAEVFQPSVESRRCRYMWLGTDLVFPAFLFHIKDTPHGVMQIHGYPYDAKGSTFIVEMHEDVWQRAGFARHYRDDLAPGESDEGSIAMLRELFPEVLDGHELYANNSRWVTFGTVRNQTWRHGNIVLLGDAAHTAHFSIGSGTKLAMEDALALAACLHEESTVDSALAAYEAERRPVVLSTQRAAQASLEWFENLGGYAHQAPEQFAFNILTRSRRVTYDNLRLRDPEFVAGIDSWFAAGGEVRPPMFQPYRLGELELKNRIVVSPMDTYSATDGTPNDFHLVHLGGKALGGAGLVMTEMVCVSASGRITPGCAGLYRPEHEDGWRRVVDFVHGNTSARIGVQIGHSGRKGSTRLMWDGIDQPLPAGNWPVCGPSPLRYAPDNQVPRELDRAEMLLIREQFADAARSAARAGFDVLELHCAHGYLLSSFLSPLTNQRTDEYGGSLANRLRYPLEVFDAVRAAWPVERPMTVRISATDWADGGVDIEEALAIADAFARHGAAGIDVSTGQVVSTEQPAYGRSFQTPFADRIRNEIGRKHGIAVIAVGAISSADDVNSILLAGRADLCALGRTHLYDPQWTLHAAAEQDYAGPAADWPAQFRAGRRRPQTGRTDGPRPRLDLVREGEPATRHARWTPDGA
ncbi:MULTISPECIES: bifunctional salicylyl-CoA 5-hydroxylase/oxidoreductase [unclassified Crossiella]|uniref:bifunctional salicylyl-CoA 5-hydroxylase/oxidoreductase n=1 Tax=unclassified Crossiella TaxID=2620835 RepID=UPI001FFF4AC7|nr:MULTISPECIES: bifunctional salicylyl-CoA 5-hydroxylase/oxidoreductase [unclassified Crossiella]MCK2242013.1 bifunctional salicylyl-CoA 5-hydroxylase/oxidoreductase [Crossiella sp. S99.2]MCK2255916.1 bifunctional salicylyl-CoA 5-hydroxylase/oxidoreductase [Crossiella sp. S99.1]